MTRIRARRPRPGLRPQHVAAVRAAALVCGARVRGAFDGSPDLRFEPGAVAAGDFRFEIATAGAATPRAADGAARPRHRRRGRAASRSPGGTHVPLAARPSTTWPVTGRPAVARPRPPLLVRAGAGRLLSAGRRRGARRGRGRWVRPRPPRPRRSGARSWTCAASSGAGRVKGDVARAAGAMPRTRRLWEARRLESRWEVRRASKAAAPGSFLLLRPSSRTAGPPSASWASGACARSSWASGRRGACCGSWTRKGPSDPHLADQLAVPLALAGGGGRVTHDRGDRAPRDGGRGGEPPSAFPPRTWGRRGGPGGLEVARC